MVTIACRVIRRRDDHGIDVFRAEQFTIVRIGFHTSIFATSALLRIVFVQCASHRVATGQTKIFPLSPVPRQVSATLSVHVADGHHLDFAEALHPEYILTPLPSCPDGGKRRLLAWSNVPFTAKHVPRNDGDRSNANHRANEPPSGNLPLTLSRETV